MKAMFTAIMYQKVKKDIQNEYSRSSLSFNNSIGLRSCRPRDFLDRLRRMLASLAGYMQLVRLVSRL